MCNKKRSAFTVIEWLFSLIALAIAWYASQTIKMPTIEQDINYIKISVEEIKSMQKEDAKARRLQDQAILGLGYRVKAIEEDCDDAKKEINNIREKR